VHCTSYEYEPAYQVNQTSNVLFCFWRLPDQNHHKTNSHQFSEFQQLRTSTMTNNTLPLTRTTRKLQRFQKLTRQLRMIWGGRKQEMLGSASLTAVGERTDACPSLEESSRSSNEEHTSCSGPRIEPSPILFIDDDEDSSYAMECMICLEGIDEAVHEDLDVLPCGHKFHRCCLNSWRFQNETCPTCRIGVEYYDTSC
jgi:hypothetical protein